MGSHKLERMDDTIKRKFGHLKGRSHKTERSQKIFYFISQRNSFLYIIIDTDGISELFVHRLSKDMEMKNIFEAYKP